MRYLCLIYQSEKAMSNISEDEMKQMMADYGAFTEDIQKKGFFLDGNPLESVTTATTVRVRDGKTLTTDGPFAETKEQLGGYYMIQCNDLDEAISVASRIPGARYGTVEIRPVMEMCGA